MASLAPTHTVADACDVCGTVAADGDTMHFVAGKLLCSECHAGQKPAVSKPPSAHEQMLLADWMAPQSRRAP